MQVSLLQIFSTCFDESVNSIDNVLTVTPKSNSRYAAKSVNLAYKIRTDHLFHFIKPVYQALKYTCHDAEPWANQEHPSS